MPPVNFGLLKYWILINPTPPPVGCWKVRPARRHLNSRGMAFRRPAAQRKSPSWRRSGNESYWESLMSEGEFVPNPQRAPRPQSAIEGARLDDWLEHLQTLQNPTEAPPLHDRTTTTRRMGDPSYSRGSSSCESSNLGSQESIPAGFIPISEHRRSWERAHIMEAPQKEQAHLCSLSPVKFGWLPIQRKVMGLDDGSTPNQMLDQCPGQVSHTKTWWWIKHCVAYGLLDSQITFLCMEEGYIYT